MLRFMHVLAHQGPTGLNPVERVLVGAVTDYVTRAAQCDVIIAR